MRHTYRAAFTVAVPTVVGGLIRWVPAPEFANVAFVELVMSEADIDAVLKTVGSTVGRILTGHQAFRIEVRGHTTRWLVGMGEWRALAPGMPLEPVCLWVADWSSLPPFPATARVVLETAA
jgi:hypothetical protein